MNTPENPKVITDDLLVKPEINDHQQYNFEDNMSVVPIITTTISVLIIVVFVVQIASNGLTSIESVINFGALVRANILAGDYKRLITSAFMHGGVDHLLSNLIALYVIGMACEHAFGKVRFTLLYFLSALFASLTSILFNEGPSVGASGAIFGIMGAIIVYARKNKEVFSGQEKRIGGVFLAWSIYTLIYGFLIPYVDNFAHIGGFVSGLLVGVIILKTSPPVEMRS